MALTGLAVKVSLTVVFILKECGEHAREGREGKWGPTQGAEKQGDKVKKGVGEAAWGEKKGQYSWTSCITYRDMRHQLLDPVAHDRTVFEFHTIVMRTRQEISFPCFCSVHGFIQIGRSKVSIANTRFCPPFSALLVQGLFALFMLKFPFPFFPFRLFQALSVSAQLNCSPIPIGQAGCCNHPQGLQLSLGQACALPRLPLIKKVALACRQR